MSKNPKVHNGLKYIPVKQYDANGNYRATQIQVELSNEPDTPKLGKRARFKLLLKDLARGAAYAISR